MNTKEIFTYVIISAITAIITVIAMSYGFFLLVQHKPETYTSLVDFISNTSEESEAISLEPQEKNVVSVVKSADPAVVAITVSKNVPTYERFYQEEFFFGNFFRIPGIRQNGTELQEVGGGSGFIVSEDGYIVTNRHVVQDESAQYTVFTNTGEQFDGVVIARDPILDIAIMKIEGESFPHLKFGDSDALEVGQSVIAIGNALAEFRNTVSVGVVSGLSRSIQASDTQGGTESLEELIQTDAAINGGNSGGPLLDLNGEVIGVNVAIVDGAQNVGFALSSNSVKNAVESVKETGKISRAYLGVRYIPINLELKKLNNLKVDHGVLVQRGQNQDELAVLPGSPAEKAGIVENDIILEADGKELNDAQSLSSIIASKKVGDELKLKILSKGEEKEINIELEEWSD